MTSTNNTIFKTRYNCITSAATEVYTGSNGTQTGALWIKGDVSLQINSRKDGYTCKRLIAVFTAFLWTSFY